jgi:outer membrane protein OmpA-like peptidoglycan-associated protein
MKLIALIAAAACACSSPPKKKTVITETAIEISDPMIFTGDAVDLPAPIMQSLDAYADTLEGNPQITLVEVRVYTKGNAELAEQRSQKVIDYLVSKHVAANRLRKAASGEANKAGADAAELIILERSDQPKPRRVITDTKVEIFDKLEWNPGTAEWKASSTKILDAVAATLAGNPNILLVEVRAYVKGNAALAEQRSQKVIEYLAAHEVGKERLQMKGVGEANAKGEDAVQFEIVKRKE